VVVATGDDQQSVRPQDEMRPAGSPLSKGRLEQTWLLDEMAFFHLEKFPVKAPSLFHSLVVAHDEFHHAWLLTSAILRRRAPTCADFLTPNRSPKRLRLSLFFLVFPWLDCAFPESGKGHNLAIASGQKRTVRARYGP
jgi:hypothetical protein